MLHDIETWQNVLANARLIERAAAIDAGDVSAVASLRRDYSAEQVSVALELAAARVKAVHKFGEERGAGLVADVAGVEQASGSGVATYKAARFHEALGDGGQVVDVCCGIGGDSMAMASAGLDVMPVDREPVRLWMTQLNAGGLDQGLCADVSDAHFKGKALHLDPARRDEAAKRRSWKLADYQPGPEVIGRLIDEAPMAGLKLSPGIDADELSWPGELEFISHGGRLVQAVLWTGSLASSERRATLLVDGQSHTLVGESQRPYVGEQGRYVYAVDPSVERACLLKQLSEKIDALMLHPMLGLFTSDRVIESPWLTGFELIERMPWRPKRVAQWLKDNDGGIAEVKTRGKACDPDREQRRLRGKGTIRYTVFVLRFDTKVEALIARRL